MRSGRSCSADTAPAVFVVRAVDREIMFCHDLIDLIRDAKTVTGSYDAGHISLCAGHRKSSHIVFDHFLLLH